jgi:hypothetical protein
LENKYRPITSHEGTELENKYRPITSHESTELENKYHPITSHEGTELENKYRSTFFINLGAIWGGWWLTPRPSRFIPRKIQVTNYLHGWVGYGDGVEGYGKYRPNVIRSPDRLDRIEPLYRMRYPGVVVQPGIKALFFYY